MRQQAAGQTVTQAVGGYADAKRDAALSATQTAKENNDPAGVAAALASASPWMEGGADRVILQIGSGALIGGLGGSSAFTGSLSGAAGAGLAAGFANQTKQVGDALSGATGSQVIGNIGGNILSGVGGALVGGSNGAAMASNVYLYNQSHDSGEKDAEGVVASLGSWLKNTYGDPVGDISRWVGQVGAQIQASGGQAAPVDPSNQLPESGGNPPSTGAAVVTGAIPLCAPGEGCVMTPALSTAGSISTIPSNATFSTGDGNNAANSGPSSPMSNSGGAARAAANSGNWSSGSLSETIENIAGPNQVVSNTNSGKTIYTNPSTGISVVYDSAGNYYRVQSATGQYLDRSGNPIPNNVPLIGSN